MKKLLNRGWLKGCECPIFRTKWLVGACLLFNGFVAQAVLPEPDNRIYGTIILGTNLITSASTNISVQARLTPSGTPIASYQMGEDPKAGNYYVLVIPMESVTPIVDPNASMSGQTVNLVVLDSGTVRDQQAFTLGSRGYIARVDFGHQIDANGLAIDWQMQYFSATGVDPNADPDHDGLSNLKEYQQGLNPLIADARHPADINLSDGTLTIQEVTTYAMAWKLGQTWSMAPTNIPIDYVTQAAFLWKNGERYHLDSGLLALGAPQWWTNIAAAGPMSVGFDSPKALSTALRPMSLEPQQGTSRNPMGASKAGGIVMRTLAAVASNKGDLEVILQATPGSGILSYAVEEVVASCQSVNVVSHEGHFDVASGCIRWGPFFDDQPRALSYQIATSDFVNADKPISGTGSFDGLNMPVRYRVQLTPIAALNADAPLLRENFSILLQGQPACSYVIEVSSDLVTWNPAAIIYTAKDGRIEFQGQRLPGSARQFYRARPEK